MSVLTKLYIWGLISIIKTLRGYTNISTKLLYAQSYTETEGFESDVFKTKRNLFGVRSSSQSGDNSDGEGYAYFGNYWQAIWTYFDSQKRSGVSNTDNQMYVAETVNAGYSNNPRYALDWLAHYQNTVNSPFTTERIALIVFFFGVVIAVLNYKRIKIIFKKWL